VLKYRNATIATGSAPVKLRKARGAGPDPTAPGEAMNAPDLRGVAREPRNHDLVDDIARPGVRYEKRAATRPDGSAAAGLYNAWITLDNPAQYNSYTTDMVKGVILAFRAASNARDVNCVVFTGAGDKAFCTGGNTQEYAEYYAGHPQEYRQYMRL